MLLAVDGGKPTRTTPVPPWPMFEADEIEAVQHVLTSGKVNYWTGDVGRKFEQEFADYCGVDHGIVVSNGTIALELALRGLGIGPGDEVVVPCFTFIASASAVAMCGATPVMADVNPETLTISSHTIEAVLTPRTKAIIAVHLVGQMCDMDPLMELAKSRGIKVVEDCAQAHGATYKGAKAGSVGDVGAFSFCQDKIMTTGGEGGMITTRDPELWRSIWALKDHGKSYDAVYNQQHPPGFRWLHDSFGTNGRMTEMQAAIGRIQLSKLPAWLDARRRNASLLDEAFQQIPALRIPKPLPETEHARYKYYAFVESDQLRNEWDRDRLMNAICAEGVPCFSGICSEIYQEKAFIQAGLQPMQRLPNAQHLGEHSLLFLVHPTLKGHDMLHVIDAVQKVFAQAVR